MKRTQAIELPEEEIAQQKEWMREFAALENRPHTYCVVTYGCQMNAHDSETLEGMLAQMGHPPKGVPEPGHNGLGAVGQGVVEIKKDSFKVHRSEGS